MYILTPPALFVNGEIDVRLKDETIPEVYSVAEKTGVDVIDIFQPQKIIAI